MKTSGIGDGDVAMLVLINNGQCRAPNDSWMSYHFDSDQIVGEGRNLAIKTALDDPGLQGLEC